VRGETDNSQCRTIFGGSSTTGAIERELGEGITFRLATSWVMRADEAW